MSITLIIKSNSEQQAREFAGQRHIHINAVCQINLNEVRAECANFYSQGIARWFNEPWPEEKHIPFPMGTLLFFRNVE